MEDAVSPPPRLRKQTKPRAAFDKIAPQRGSREKWRAQVLHCQPMPLDVNHHCKQCLRAPCGNRQQIKRARITDNSVPFARDGCHVASDFVAQEPVSLAVTLPIQDGDSAATSVVNGGAA